MDGREFGWSVAHQVIRSLWMSVVFLGDAVHIPRGHSRDDLCNEYIFICIYNELPGKNLITSYHLIFPFQGRINQCKQMCRVVHFECLSDFQMTVWAGAM